MVPMLVSVKNMFHRMVREQPFGCLKDNVRIGRIHEHQPILTENLYNVRVIVGKERHS